MAAFIRYHVLAADMLGGIHDFDTHVFKAALTNRAPVVATDVGLSDIAEISAGNGYSAGGVTVDVISISQSAGVGKVVASLDDTITASGGSIGPYRYIVLYNDTSTGDKLVGYWDKGAAVTLLDTDSQALDYDQSAGILTLTV